MATDVYIKYTAWSVYLFASHNCELCKNGGTIKMPFGFLGPKNHVIDRVDKGPHMANTTE